VIQTEKELQGLRKEIEYLEVNLFKLIEFVKDLNKTVHKQQKCINYPRFYIIERDKIEKEKEKEKRRKSMVNKCCNPSCKWVVGCGGCVFQTNQQRLRYIVDNLGWEDLHEHIVKWNKRFGIYEKDPNVLILTKNQEQMETAFKEIKECSSPSELQEPILSIVVPQTLIEAGLCFNSKFNNWL